MRRLLTIIIGVATVTHGTVAASSTNLNLMRGCPVSVAKRVRHIDGLLCYVPYLTRLNIEIECIRSTFDLTLNLVHDKAH